MRNLCVGASWILKYAIGEILLDDIDDFEEEFIVYDQTANVDDFFHFAPISRYAGDERIKIVDKIGAPNWDCCLIDTNVIDDVKQFIDNFRTEERVILLSSADVYGYQGRRQIPFDEWDTPLLPTSQLGKTKLAQEKLIETLPNSVILRLSQTFGPYMPEDSEIIEWLKKILTNREVLVEQPAARAYDLNYVTNLNDVIDKVRTVELKGERIFNIGSADVDFKEQNLQNPKARPQVMLFEKQVVNLLVGLRHQLGSESRISVLNEGIDIYQGKGFHTQVKTERARKILEYSPMVDTARGLFQTAYWLQKTDEEAQGGKDMEELYPTLTEEGMKKIGLDPDSAKKFSEIRKQKIKEIDESLLCGFCQHIPQQAKQFIPGVGDLSADCPCKCHDSYRESKEVLK